MKGALTLPGWLLLAACASVSPERGHDEVGRLVAARTGSSTGWENGPPEDSAISERIASMVATGLTRNKAVAIALVNNPGLQTTYEELGVSQADMVQAGLLKNPSLGGSLGFPLSSGRLEYEFSLVQEIVDLITLSWRKDSAERQFKANTLRVAQEALDLVSRVSRAFVTFQADLENEKLVRLTVLGAQAAHQLAEKQYAAGNITELALATHRASYAQLQLELTNSEVRVAAEREQLCRLLGLWGKEASWSAAEALPEVPGSDFVPEHAEALAIRQRLDLDAARLDAEVLGQAVGLARGTRFIGRIEVGGHAHQDANGPLLAGPTLVLELPIFDQRQALIARLEAEQRAAERRVSRLAVETRSKVREGLLSLKAARATAQYYRDTLVPLREQIVETSQLQYNGMLLGPYRLISARLESLESQRSAIAARRDYWIARFELENALGGSLSTAGGAGSR